MRARKFPRTSATHWAAGIVIALLLSFGEARAQYMYIDVNGDGVHTAADLLSNTTPSIDIWLRTNFNRDGSAAVCVQSEAQLTLNSYAVLLHASGPITWGAWTDLIGYIDVLGTVNLGSDFYAGRYGNQYPPGTYRLGRLAISGIASTTSLSFLPGAPLPPYAVSFYQTSFATQCDGKDYDNTYKLGSDWHDADGVGQGCVDPVPGDTFPNLAVAATASGTEGNPFQQFAWATDPDAGNGLTVGATGAPSTLVLTNNLGVSPVTAKLSGVLGYSDAGSYAIRWSVNDGQCATDTATTILTVTNLDRTPIVSTPATVNATEGAHFAFIATASDPDGNPIEGISASPLPSGATFTPSDAKTSGTFEWTPDYTQAGNYNIQITAVSACRAVTISGATYTVCMTGGAPTLIHVSNADQPPIVTVPPRIVGNEGSTLSFLVAAGDPDGSAISSLTTSPLPAGATFTPRLANTEGLFEWAPAYGQAGTYTVTFAALSTLSASENTQITINTGPDRPPIVTSPATFTGLEGALATFTGSASDPDGQPIESFTAGPLPPGAAFSVNATRSMGTFEWTPDLTQAGTYVITLSAESACRPTGVSGVAACVSGTATTTITIANLNRAPTADAGGPYSGMSGVAIEFDGSGSTDPDGDALTYAWDFGDGGTGAGALASHSYGVGGTYDVTLRVNDGAASSAASTTATVQSVLPALALTTSANRVIRLGSGKATWCAQLEPVGGSYANSDVVMESAVLLAGSSRIPALTEKSNVGDDKNRDGVEELTVCFPKEALRTALLGLVPKGNSVLTLAIEADLVKGGRIHTDLTVSVSSPGSSLSSTISPNPMNPDATLTFVMSRSGWVRVSLFDLQGRQMRRVLEKEALDAGIHDVRVDGMREDGARLPSGVYFYRVETSEGASLGRIVITK